MYFSSLRKRSFVSTCKKLKNNKRLAPLKRNCPTSQHHIDPIDFYNDWGSMKMMCTNQQHCDWIPVRGATANFGTNGNVETQDDLSWVWNEYEKPSARALGRDPNSTDCGSELWATVVANYGRWRDQFLGRWWTLRKCLSWSLSFVFQILKG